MTDLLHQETDASHSTARPGDLEPLDALVSDFVERAAEQSTRISHEFLRDPHLSDRAARVGGYILSFGPGTKLSNLAISRALNLNPRTVSAAKTDLAEAGYLIAGVLADVKNRAQSAPSEAETVHFLHNPPVLQILHSADSAQSAESTQFGAETTHFVQEPIRVVDGTAEDAVLAPPHAVPRNRATNRSKEESTEPLLVEVQGKQKDLSEPPAEAPTEPKPVAKAKPKKARYAYTEDFELAWSGYGRRGAKSNAFIEWTEALERADIETILAGVIAYVESTPNPKYRKHFERWLKGDCWEEQPISKVAPIERADDRRYQGSKSRHDAFVAGLTHEEKIKYGVIHE